MNQKLKDLLASLSSVEKDDLYRLLWSEHVKEDVECICEEDEIDYDDDFVAQVVNLYVYQGKYDCNLSYWENIRNLIALARGSI